jgi:hypothetical protein
MLCKPQALGVKGNNSRTEKLNIVSSLDIAFPSKLFCVNIQIPFLCMGIFVGGDIDGRLG